MTQPRALRISLPGHPVLAYAPHAQGCEVPDFAVILTPQTCYGPSRAHIVPRKPYEAGAWFHARCCALAHRHAEGLGVTPDYVCVWFTAVLPTREWRDRWAQQQSYLWALAMYDTPSTCRQFAAAKLAAMGLTT
jgi:hypothetical protein